MCAMVLKEAILYYIKYQPSVYCTFLDASKAFGRVLKLFRLLIMLGLPACKVRIIINMYRGSQVRVLWASLASDYLRCSFIEQQL